MGLAGLWAIADLCHIRKSIHSLNQTNDGRYECNLPLESVKGLRFKCGFCLGSKHSIIELAMDN